MTFYVERKADILIYVFIIDEDIAKQLVSMIHECERNNEGDSDDCQRVLEISKCFRTKIHELKWAPSMEVLLEEIMTEV